MLAYQTFQFISLKTARWISGFSLYVHEMHV